MAGGAVPVLMFAGQSSSCPQLLEEMLHGFPGLAEPVVQAASDALGRDLRAKYAGVSPFVCNRDVQVGVFLANHLRLAILEAHGVMAKLSMGLSLGEYNHLVHIGALTFEDALALVDARGRLYDEGPSGRMVAIHPLDLDELEPIVERAREVGVVEVAVLCSPTQHVLAGERAAVERAVELCEEETFAFATVIEDRLPMHSSWFEPVADRLGRALEATAWRPPHAPYLPNISATLEWDPPRERILDLLRQHVHRPVRWRDSIDAVVQQYPDAHFIEVGPRSVLYGLLRAPWCTSPRDHTADLDAIGRVIEQFGTVAP